MRCFFCPLQEKSFCLIYYRHQNILKGRALLNMKEDVFERWNTLPGGANSYSNFSPRHFERVNEETRRSLRLRSLLQTNQD